MSGELRTIPTPRGDFIFRPERPDDEPFLFRLFAAHNSAILRASGFPAETIEKLINHTQEPAYKELLQAFIEYAKVNKILGTFISAFEEATSKDDSAF